MTILFYLLLLTFLGIGLSWLFVSTPAAQIATLLSKTGPIALAGIGGFLTLIGRGGIGIPIAALGLAWWRRTRSMGSLSSGANGQKSTVRSAALEMELDHDSGDMNGRVLLGEFEGQWLSDLSNEDLLSIYETIKSDSESVALLEAYLDRRLSDWREHADAHHGDGEGFSPGSGSMTKEEAYQVLGLEPGATKAEIRKAWRNLMKSMHPDSGGSEFLAAKINAAKDILLN